MKWFNNFKIGIRLFIGFGVIVMITVIISLFGMNGISKMNALDNQLYEKMTEPLEQLVTIRSSYSNIGTALRDVVLSKNQNDIAKYADMVNINSDNFDNELEEFSKTLITDLGKQKVGELKEAKVNYMKLSSKIIDMCKNGKNEEALNLIYNDLKTPQSNMENALKSIATLKVSNAKNFSESNNEIARTVKELVTALMCVGVLVSVLLGVFISSSVSKPIKQIMESANKIAQGDLDVCINVDSKDEIGVLENSFKNMADNLNEVMTSISFAADQVATGSRQVSDSSISLSQGASEQASSIEQLTASLEEISSNTKFNADNSNAANKLTEHVKVSADEGSLHMKEMLQSMDEISTASGNIYKIIKVIDEIAFQTNILALNAAVEAARAGQYGKGFAVVAEEVRNLAAKSADAAKETTSLIENSIKKSERGTKIVGETSEAFDKIVKGIMDIDNIVREIAAASSEQAAGLEEIKGGIMQVSEVVQQNSATSEESAAASEELSSQAELMREQVGKFKLRRLNNA
ncbi:methyl-accepting chemotaxis protein [Clostridium sp. WILCCON 0269]|uniref:Methyl-accepting chemotaxis protein n=1 Tax=Candidatus Clostridium eludens TaxID=3381663 RepID=A0ABW8SJU7_9CLOT